MPRLKPSHRVRLAIAIVVFSAITSMGAAILHTNKQISDENLSLRNITATYLEVIPPSPTLTKHGVNAANIKTLCTDLLHEEGIDVLDEPDDSMPTLQVIMITKVAESDASNAVAVCVYLTLQQPVLVERIDRRMRLPTWSTLDMQVRAPKAIEASTNASVQIVMNHFHGIIRQADGFMP